MGCGVDVPAVCPVASVAAAAAPAAPAAAALHLTISCKREARPHLSMRLRSRGNDVLFACVRAMGLTLGGVGASLWVLARVSTWMSTVVTVGMVNVLCRMTQVRTLVGGSFLAACVGPALRAVAFVRSRGSSCASKMSQLICW